MEKYLLKGIIGFVAIILVSVFTLPKVESANMTNVSSMPNLNITRSQAFQFGELHGKLMKEMLNILRESKSNLTRANEIVLDKLVAKGLVTKSEKDTLLPYLSPEQRSSAFNLRNTQGGVSNLLGEFYKNNSSVAIIGLTSILNNSLSNINSTNMVMTSEISPLPYGLERAFAASVGDVADADWFCGGTGLLVGVGLSYAAAAACSALSASGVLEG